MKLHEAGWIEITKAANGVIVRMHQPMHICTSSPDILVFESIETFREFCMKFFDHAVDTGAGNL